MKDQRGKIVVMNFWTVTCQPCVEEMPSLITLAEIAKRRKDIELVAITSDKDWAAVAPIFPPRSNLKILFDPERKVIKDKYGSKLFPETWVIDGDGSRPHARRRPPGMGCRPLHRRDRTLPVEASALFRLVASARERRCRRPSFT